MKHTFSRRLAYLLLSLALTLSLLCGLTASAADEIWTEPPTGWTDGAFVWYEQKDGLTLNWGVRGETGVFLSEKAVSYYPSKNWWYFLPGEYPGGTGEEDAAQSPLYQQLRAYLLDKQTHQTTLAEVRAVLRYTDCMANQSGSLSSFFSGRRLKGAWDSGKTWKLASIWPASKASAAQNEDILLLRPVSVQEDAARGSKAYGVSEGYYDPNHDASGQFDVRGDVARSLLYAWIRYENHDRMWGKDGVIESLDVLLDWIREDPVDTWEMGRNDAVQSVTGVRNCFVDYPELAWALFGRECLTSTTPCQAQGWPPVTVAVATITASSNNEDWGTAYGGFSCVTVKPAEGCYITGYSPRSYQSIPEGADPAEYPQSTFRWDHGRLLFFPAMEYDEFVEIQFQPIGKPASATVALGKTATFQISAKGADLRYQWQYQKYGETVWHNWSGKTARTLTVTGSRTNNGCKYRCLVINEAGSFPSLPATLTVSGAPLPPTVKTQPAAVKAKLGTEVSFTVKASGDALSYQWQYSKDNGAHWHLWSGKTEPTLRVKASRTNNGCLYRCEIKNSTGAILSGAARLTVTDIQPSIVGQPKDFSAPLGKSVTIKVAAAGSGLSYQWQYKKVGDTAWHNWSGKTSSKLEITGSRTNDNCLYRCVVKNSYGTVISESVRLAVR